MFVKKTLDCEAFVANDGCQIRELLHPENDAVELPYSLAIATVDVNKQSYRHQLQQTEVYYILQGHGRMTIDSEARDVLMGDAIVVPARATQWIENIGNEALVFAAIVSPPWTEAGDVRLDQ